MLAGTIGFAQGQGRVEKSTGGEQWEGWVFSCDGDSGPFDVWERYEGTWVDSMRYDKNGNPVQLIRTVKFPIDVMWNTTTGKTLKGGPGLRNEIRIGINEKGEWVSSESSGPVIKFIIPGYGPVYIGDRPHTMEHGDVDDPVQFGPQRLRRRDQERTAGPRGSERHLRLLGLEVGPHAQGTIFQATHRHHNQYWDHDVAVIYSYLLKGSAPRE